MPFSPSPPSIGLSMQRLSSSWVSLPQHCSDGSLSGSCQAAAIVPNEFVLGTQRYGIGYGGADVGSTQTVQVCANATQCSPPFKVTVPKCASLPSPNDQFYLSPGNSPLEVSQGSTGLANLVMAGPWIASDLGNNAEGKVVSTTLPSGLEGIHGPRLCGSGSRARADAAERVRSFFGKARALQRYGTNHGPDLRRNARNHRSDRDLSLRPGEPVHPRLVRRHFEWVRRDYRGRLVRQWSCLLEPALLPGGFFLLSGYEYLRAYFLPGRDLALPLYRQVLNGRAVPERPTVPAVLPESQRNAAMPMRSLALLAAPLLSRRS